MQQHLLMWQHRDMEMVPPRDTCVQTTDTKAAAKNKRLHERQSPTSLLFSELQNRGVALTTNPIILSGGPVILKNDGFIFHLHWEEQAAVKMGPG